MYANPVPLDPYKPTPSCYDDPQRTPLLPSRLPIFSPVIWLNNKIMQIFTEKMWPGGHLLTSQTDLHLADGAEFVEEGMQTHVYSPVTALTTPTRRHKNSGSGKIRVVDN
jgi:etoposide-induced 2.4 mRNA